MKKLLLPILVLLLTISCTNQNKATKANEALINKYVKAVENIDTATMESLLADNYEGLGPSSNDRIDKKGAIKSWERKCRKSLRKYSLQQIQNYIR